MKVGRYIGLLILGGIVGGIIGGVIGVAQNFNIKRLLLFADFKNSVTISMISTILTLILVLTAYVYLRSAFKNKKVLESNIYDEEADLYVLGHGSLNVYFIALIPFCVTAIMYIINGIYIHKIDSRMPKLGEKNYTEKRLSLMDEGERHITLKSLFKVNVVTISLIIFGIVILYAYSMLTNSNQSIGMLVLIIIFIYNSLTYTFKVAKYYKN